MRKGQRLDPIAQAQVLASKGKILVIDEDSKDLRLYSNVLQENGFLVWAVSSHAEGSESVWKHDPDLVIVSQGGPAFEGRCVLESAIARNRRMRVVVLTRVKEMRCYLEAMQLGAVDYLEKPRESAKILEMARRHLRPYAATVKAGTPRSARKTAPRSATRHRVSAKH